MPPEPPPAYILAGGRSSRFGSDKARAELHGLPLIVRQARQLESCGHRVTVVARSAGQYEDLGLHTIADLEPDRGPVGGVITALRHRAEGWAFITSCDLLVLQPHWLTDLLAVAEQHRPHAVAFRDDRWQPFPSLLHTRLLDQAEVWQRFSFQHLLSASRAWPVALPSDWPPVVQANTPDDLRCLDAEAAP